MLCFVGTSADGHFGQFVWTVRHFAEWLVCSATYAQTLVCLPVLSLDERVLDMDSIDMGYTFY